LITDAPLKKKIKVPFICLAPELVAQIDESRRIKAFKRDKAM
jgi:hypothetical protein